MKSLAQLRKELHQSAAEEFFGLSPKGKPNFADGSSEASVDTARRLLAKIVTEPATYDLTPQTIGRKFEDLICDYVEKAFKNLGHLRPAEWRFDRTSKIGDFEQYSHLVAIKRLKEAKNGLKIYQEVQAALGADYTVKPDLTVFRLPLSDKDVNGGHGLVNESVAKYSPLLARNQRLPMLHASVSCKYTIRSDRAQNSRLEALNLLRFRKGRAPHIVVVTAEPTANRIKSIALGTGDIDCTYHFALYELEDVIREVGSKKDRDLLAVMIEGRRLRDISDLPLDLAI